MARMATQIRIDEEIHQKLKVVSTKELRSLNSQIEYFIIKGIESFEKENGIIDSESLELPVWTSHS